MSFLSQPQLNDDDMLPIDSDMIGKLTGYESAVISSDDLKRIKRMARRMQTGCIVLEIVDGKLSSIDQVLKYMIDPAEK